MNQVSTINEEAPCRIRTRQLLARIFYRPSEVFAIQKGKPTWGRVFLLWFAISLTDMTITDLSPSREEPVDSEAAIDRSVVSERSESSRVRVLTEIGESVEDDLGSLTNTVGNAFKVSFYRLISAVPTLADATFTLVVLLVVLFVEALYLRLVSAVFGLGLKLDHWLALVSWSRIPGESLVLILTVVMVVSLFVLSSLIGHESVPLKLIFEGPVSSSHSLSFLLHYSFLAMLWSITVQTIGFRDWSGKSTSISFVIVIVPTVIGLGLIWWLVG